MVTSPSKNQSFICAMDICDDKIASCLECNTNAAENVHPLKKLIHDLWINIRLFFETDKWKPTVTLKVGDSHYTMKMDDIESRWRDPNSDIH